MDRQPTPPDPYGAFRTTARGAPGLTRRQVDGEGFVAPSRGVRYAADDPDPGRALRECAILGSRADAVLTGPSAALQWGLPVPPWLGLRADVPAQVAVPAGSAHPDRRGVVGRRLLLPPEHMTTCDGQPVTTPARTWLDCAAQIPIGHLIAMGDAILHGRLATHADLDAVVAWAFRRRGVLSARRARPWLDGASESPGESLARAHLVLNGVPRPVCNLDIHANGVWVARVDMCWPDHRLIVEYDGAVHLEESVRRRDARRRNQLLAAGWLVITFTAEDMRQPWLMAIQVKKALAARPTR